MFELNLLVFFVQYAPTSSITGFSMIVRALDSGSSPNLGSPLNLPELGLLIYKMAKLISPQVMPISWWELVKIKGNLLTGF